MIATLKTISADDLARIAFGDKYTPFSKKTICKACKNKEIPSRKVGREWRILEDVARDWLLHRNR